MTEAVRKADDRGPIEGADDQHLRERGVASPSPGGRGRRRRNPADGQPARASARTTADGPHVERRPDRLDPLAAAALADGGLTAKTILRAADVRPGQTALVIGATSRAGTVLVPLLAEAGVHVIAGTRPDDDDLVRSLGATETVECTTADPVADALTSHPEVDLLVDLASFGEPYFITAGARHGTIITALDGARGPGLPRIGISAVPGDLAALARRALGPDHQLPGRSGGTVPAGLNEVSEQPAAAKLDAAA
jgi:hypothetical protein